MRRAIVITCLLAAFTNLGAQPEKLLDSARAAMQSIKNQLSKRLESYRERYTGDSLVLKSLTVYEYSSEGKLLLEKGVSDDFNNCYTFKDRQMVEKLTELNGHLDVERNAFDKDGKLLSQLTLNDYFPKHLKKETYTTEERKHFSNDSLTLVSLVNGYPMQRTLYVYKDGQVAKTLSYKSSSDTVPDTEFLFESRGKRVNKITTHMHKLNYHKETVMRYNKNGEIESYLTKDLTNGEVDETLSYYKDTLLVQSEEFENGQVKLRRSYDYNAKGLLLCETAREATGKLRYRCMYEYDAKGRKTAYLYFFVY